MSIEITRYHDAPQGARLAFVNIKLKNLSMFINNIAVFSKNGFRWTSFPSQKYEKDGEVKYQPHLGFDTKELKESFDKKFFEAFDKYIDAQQPVKAKSKTVCDEEECPF